MSHVDRPARMATATATVKPPVTDLAGFLSRSLNTTVDQMAEACRYLTGLCEGCEYDQNDWVTVPYDTLSDLVTAYRGAAGLLAERERA